jgi:hypothetical protein
LELHFRGGKVSLLQWRSESGEDCSGGILEPRWSVYFAYGLAGSLASFVRLSEVSTSMGGGGGKNGRGQV